LTDPARVAKTCLWESPAGKGKAMHDWKSQSHVKWDCKYHIVFIPKYRQKVLYGKLRKQIGKILRELCRQKGVEMQEGKAMSDHIHICLSIPPKYSVAHVVGFLKGKSAIRIHREILGEKRMTGLHFWAKGYCVSTIGYDEEAVKRYIREQEEHDSNQMSLDLE
jgi:putative transposase